MKDTGGFLTGAFLGGATALFGAALLSPKAKSDLHKDMKHKVNKFSEQHPEVTKLVKSKTNDVFDCLEIIKNSLNKYTDGKFDNWLDQTFDSFTSFEENSVEIADELPILQEKEEEEDIVLTMGSEGNNILNLP
jgi:gas vesicle protein